MLMLGGKEEGKSAGSSFTNGKISSLILAFEGLRGGESGGEEYCKIIVQLLCKHEA